MIYDYRLNDNKDIDMDFDSLNSTEIKLISELIQKVKAEEAERRKKESKEWMYGILTNILQNFAQETNSRLEIKEKETGIQVVLENSVGILLSEKYKELRWAMLAADSIGIGEKNRMIQIFLEYSV